MSKEPPLLCYRCKRPAAPVDTVCANCGLLLDWGAISDLRSLDYLKLRIEQWRRQGVLDVLLANRLRQEAERNHAALLGALARGTLAAPAQPRPAPRNLKPRYSLAEAAVQAPPPPFRPAPPPFRPAPPPPPPPEPDAPARRPILDVLVEIGTVRLMLYTGAVLFAAGVMVWLRDMLRVQLQKPVVQAGLLGLVTFGALAGGVALVVKARERDEQRLIGRGVLFLGTLLLPLNPWFWVQTGLVESRGNAWTVTLVTFAVSLAIALGLGDRVFVYMSYGAALLTGWLLTFKLTGGTTPGAYAIVLSLISGAYMLAERPVARVAERRNWEKLGGAFFLCGHIGIALTLVFYTSIVRHLPPELIATFRHFDASGYTPWTGVAVALLAAQAYLYSAWRRDDARFTYIGTGVALWSAALSLFAWQAPRGAWLAACGLASLAAYALGRAFARVPLWGPPLSHVSTVVAWVGVVAAIAAAAAFATGTELRWFTALGAALLAVRFAAAATEGDRPADAAPVPALVLLVAAWALRRAGVSWVYVDAMLAVMLAAVPLLAAMLPGDRDATRAVLRRVSSALAVGLLLPAVGFATTTGAFEAYQPALLAAALAVAFAVNGWAIGDAAWRYALFALAGLAVEGAVALGLTAVRVRLGLHERFATFGLVPLAYAFLAAWLAARRSTDEVTAAASRIARAWASIAAGVAAAAAVPLLLDGTLDERGSYLFGLALALAAAVPLVAAAVERDTEVATVEGTYGLFLAIVAYVGAGFGVADTVHDDWRGFTALVLLGLLPLALALVERATGQRAPSLCRPARVYGAALALVSMLALAPMLTPDWTREGAFDGPDHLAFIALALLLAGYGVRSALAYEGAVWRALWTTHAAVATSMAAHGTIRLAVPVAATALLMTGLAAALVAGGARAARVGERLAPVMLAVGHGLAVVSLANAIAAEPARQPIGWLLVLVFAATAVCYAAGSLMAERGSTLDHAHRGLAALATFATASAALHAAGYTTATSQFEPLAALLTLGMIGVLAAPGTWSRETAAWFLHALMAVLVVAVVSDPYYEGAWTAAGVARAAAFACAFYTAGAFRASAVSAAAAVASACLSLGALLEHLDAPNPARAIAFAVFGTALAIAAARLGERFDWLRGVLAVSGHGLVVVSTMAELALVAPRLVVGAPELSEHVAAFGALTAIAWALGRALGEIGAPYRVAWRVAALATYALVGLRLGFHPWHDSAFYTVPIGALLVGLGVYASRRDERLDEAAPLLWLGSLLAAGPMLLHALDNRFVRDVSPVGYDIGTLSVGLALALVGLLFQLRAPSIVAAVVLATDVFVIAFSQIRWSQLTLALFGVLVGGLLFVVSWLILYRRDDLYRMRDFVRERHEMFRQWK